MMRTFVFLPPVRRATGGVAVLRTVAEVLARAGREAFLVPRESGQAYLEDAAAPVVPWDALSLSPGDCWLVPEGWPNALAPGLAAKARCLVYVQNWAYLFSALPQGADWRGLPVSFLAVSDPVRRYILETIGRDCPVLRPGIDLARFAAPAKKPGGPLRVAFMPRKNKALAEQIRDGFTARRRGAGLSEVHWLAVENMSQAEVAAALSSAHVFLATGFPEGCPLPPLEAMASGCLCVGFGGFGGHDYMRQAGDFPGAYAPWWELRDVPWGGNGLWCADADVAAAVNGLVQAAAWWETGDARLGPALAAGQATARACSAQAQSEAVLTLWEEMSRD
ncbi:glycosyl transferase group 1 [Desulfovibrio sp. X2]|uniref:glycosyl transferase group 1 n=1 Tax=Desulfovibrio sp. X2 TaxID=941449 RepID=UPI000358A76D|nr:glycosyl transferase group 1 [Desulfovibrio sp. X2]EPR41698.1 glycosyl transferase group 1 [Desulfovibrio sp. X2]